MIPRSATAVDLPARDVLVGDSIPYGLQWMEVQRIATTGNKVVFHGEVNRRGEMVPVSEECDLDFLVITRPTSAERPTPLDYKHPHEHHHDGQTLRHAHIDGHMPHGYFEHPGDPHT